MRNGYANSEALVSTKWVAEHLDDPNVRLIESPGAVKIDWQEDLTIRWCATTSTKSSLNS